MLRMWTRYVIGGESGKREGAWAVFLPLAALTAWASWNEAHGVEMTATFGLLTVALPTAMVAILAAHGLEHVSRKGMPGR